MSVRRIPVVGRTHGCCSAPPAARILSSPAANFGVIVLQLRDAGSSARESVVESIRDQPGCPRCRNSGCNARNRFTTSFACPAATFFGKHALYPLIALVLRTSAMPMTITLASAQADVALISQALAVKGIAVFKLGSRHRQPRRAVTPHLLPP